MFLKPLQNGKQSLNMVKKRYLLEMEKRRTVWDTLAWIVVGLITLWLILKVSGIINTPLIVQYSPLFGAVYLAGYMVQKLKRATEDLQDIKGEVKTIKEDVTRMDKDVHIIKEKIK